VLGFRGDDTAFRDWISFATEIGGEGGQVLGITAFRAEVALMRGQVEQAVEILEEAPGVFLFWWRPLYLATRAEALARAQHPQVEAALAEARRGVGDNPYAGAVTRRAVALHEGDEAGIREALATFERIECPHQVARTAWLLGERERAERAFAELRIPIPVA
jgi:hypothetical protein